MSDWEKWVHKITQGATSREVGRRIGHSHSTALRWMRSGASPQAVIALALAYDADVIQALVAAGWIAPELVGSLNLDGAVRAAPTVKLTAEVHHRAADAARKHVPFDGR